MIFARAKELVGGREVVFSTPQIDKIGTVYFRSVNLFTQMYDSDAFPIYEGDVIEIRDSYGGVLHKGVVGYSTSSGAFHLYDEIGEPILDLPLGKLIGYHLAFVMSDKKRRPNGKTQTN